MIQNTNNSKQTQALPKKQNQEPSTNNSQVPMLYRRSSSQICCQIAMNRFVHPQQEPASVLKKRLSKNASFVSQGSKQNQNVNVLKKKYTITQQKAHKKLEEYQREPSYVRLNDWKIDEKKGGAILYNKDKKSMMSKILGFICKKVISNGSFMGISLPVFGLKPESMLQTYGKCLGAAPLILQRTKPTPQQRMKAFNTIILTFSLQFNDIQKPFNPVIGQTFQGEIGGCKYYAEQTSHHPPITSFFLQGREYIIYGSMELSANLGMNSANGLFYGDIVLQFRDGGVVKGRLPTGGISGLMFGETKVNLQGACYSYDPNNKLVTSYYLKQKDTLVGQIGKLLPSAEQKFFSLVNSTSRQKYQKFKHISQKQYQIITSRLQAQWTKQVKFNNQIYFNYQQLQNLPIKMTQNLQALGQKLLRSDSSFRKDIRFRAEGKNQQAQQQKERTQEQERGFRKLRQRNNKNQ